MHPSRPSLGPPTPLHSGYRVYFWGVALTPTSIQCRGYRKGRAKFLLPLWAFIDCQVCILPLPLPHYLFSPILLSLLPSQVQILSSAPCSQTQRPAYSYWRIMASFSLVGETSVSGQHIAAIVNVSMLRQNTLPPYACQVSEGHTAPPPRVCGYHCVGRGLRGAAVALGTALQARRSRARFPMV